jgi:hypothetical protein
MSLPSSSSIASSLSTIDEKCEMGAPRADDLLVRDFGWPSLSPRYHGDHTPESNPDWDHDPLECKKAKQEAFEKMERSYALYMANLGRKVPAPKKKASWSRFLPWVR